MNNNPEVVDDDYVSDASNREDSNEPAHEPNSEDEAVYTDNSVSSNDDEWRTNNWKIDKTAPYTENVFIVSNKLSSLRCNTLCTIFFRENVDDFHRYYIKIIPMPIHGVCEWCRSFKNLFYKLKLDSKFTGEIKWYPSLTKPNDFSLNYFDTVEDVTSITTWHIEVQLPPLNFHLLENNDEEVIRIEDDDECYFRNFYEALLTKKNEKIVEYKHHSVSDVKEELIKLYGPSPVELIDNCSKYPEYDILSKYLPSTTEYLDQNIKCQLYRAVLIMQSSPIVRICLQNKKKIYWKKYYSDHYDPKMIKNFNIITEVYNGLPFVEIDGVNYNCTNWKVIMKIITMQMEQLEDQSLIFEEETAAKEREKTFEMIKTKDKSYIDNLISNMNYVQQLKARLASLCTTISNAFSKRTVS